MSSVQEKWGTKIHWLSPKPPQPVWNFPEILRGDAQSMSHPLTYTVQAAFEKAVQEGTRVMFPGHGGDDFMDRNIPVANKMLLKGDLIHAWRFISAFKKFNDAPIPWLINSVIYGPLVSLIPSPLKKFYRILNPKKTYPWIRPPYANQVLNRLHSKPWYSFDRTSTATYSKPNYNVIHVVHRINVFERWNRLSARAGGLETRYPFCDRRLVEFVLAIPDEVMLFNDEPKGLLRDAMNTRLPALIRHRKDKADYGNLINKWLFVDYVPFAKELLDSPYLEQLGIIDGGIASRIYDDCCNKNGKGLHWDISEGFIQLFFLEAWAREAFNKEANFNKLTLTNKIPLPVLK
jgi:asparagine synthase (glutamine-hydrolysing)